MHTVIEDFINPARPRHLLSARSADDARAESSASTNPSRDGADIALAAIDKHEKDHPGQAIS